MLAEVLPCTKRIAIFTEPDYFATARTSGGLVFRRVLKSLKVVLICTVVNIDFGLEIGTTFGAILPSSWMPLLVVEATKGIAIVITIAAVARV
jgi:hypothetical protein